LSEIPVTSVIYLTDTRFGQQAWEHPSARHRCYHYADALLASGSTSLVVPMERASVKMLEKFEHIVFHRPSNNSRFKHALSCCQKVPAIIHADYDDLIFHPQFAVHSPLYLTGNRSLEKVTNQFQKTYEAAHCFNNFILSTDFLRKKLLEIFPDVIASVVHNSLPRLFKRPRPCIKSDAPLTIGYFPGSNGHGEDFSSIRAALGKITENNVRLLITGRLDKRYFDGIENVVHIPFVDYKKYLYLLSSVDLSIAPLTESVFNYSKSAVKLIESVSVATPIVTSNNGDMQDHKNKMSVVVEKNDSWYAALTDCLSLVRENQQNNYSIADDLAGRYSVNARIPALRDHLQCAA